MTANPKRKAADAINTNDLHSLTAKPNSLLDESINQAHFKAISLQDARSLAARGASLVGICLSPPKTNESESL